MVLKTIHDAQADLVIPWGQIEPTVWINQLKDHSHLDGRTLAVIFKAKNSGYEFVIFHAPS